MADPHTGPSAIRTVEISGAPRARGRQHGEAAADLIAQGVAFYEASFGERTGLTWSQVGDRAMAWNGLCRAAAPHLVEEIAGIAEGSGRTVAEIMALNIRGEVSYDPHFAQRPTGDDSGSVDGCTSFALMDGASGDGHRYTGQNWDWAAGVVPTVIALRIRQDPAPTVIMQVEAGQIGRHGVNSAGISLNANGLGGRIDDSFGLPQTFLRRMTLDQHRFSDALAQLTRQRPHICSNALLAHASGYAVDLETTPGPVSWLHPVDGLLVHGNHFQAGVPPQLAASYRPVSPDSLYRVELARARLAAVRESTDASKTPAVVREAMSDHFGFPDSLCEHPDETRPLTRRWATMSSSLHDLTSGQFRIAHGNPCCNDYELMPWNMFDGPSELDARTGGPR